MQNVANETGLGEQPTTVVSNNDKLVRQMLSLLYKVGRQIISEPIDYQVLQKEETFTSDGSGSYARSAIFTDGDFERYVDNTDWDRSDNRKMILVTAQEWQELKSGVVNVAGINRYYREQGNNILVTPDASGDTLVFEYISNYWITDSAGTTSKGSFTADTDLVKFPEYLVELGLKYYVRANKGLPAAIDMENFKDALERYKANQTPNRVIGPSYPKDLSFNIPDTGIGQ